MPKLAGAEDKAKAKIAWELIYKRRSTLKGKQSPKTLARTPGTHLPGHSLTHFSLLQRVFCEGEKVVIVAKTWWQQ